MPASATAASPALPTATPRAAQQADNSRNGAPGQGTELLLLASGCSMPAFMPGVQPRCL